MQVPVREELDRQSHDGHRDHDDRAEVVDQESQRHLQLPERERPNGGDHRGVWLVVDGVQDVETGKQRQHGTTGCDERTCPPVATCHPQSQYRCYEGDEDNQPGGQRNRICHEPASLRSMWPRSRNSARITASATPISAAAMVMRKSVRTLPVRNLSSTTEPIVTNNRLAALRSSSTPISTRTDRK